MKFKSFLWFLSSLLLLVIQSLWVFFLPVKWCCITITIFDCCFLSFLFVSSLQMSATNRLYHCLNFKYFAERSYYRYISLFLPWPLLARLCGVTIPSSFIPEQWRRITITVVYCYFFIFICFLLMDECEHSSWSLIVKKVLYRAIISSLYIIVSYTTPVGPK